MEAGARVLWPAKEPYYDLQALREKLGRAAFDKEKQNAPWADGAAVFAAFGLRRFRLRDGVLVCDPPVGAGGAVTHATDGRPEIPLGALRLFGFLDPALGGSGAGDFAAIATVGVDGQGYCYVLDVWLGRAGPSAQVQRVFDLHERWGYERFGVETNAFQQLLLDPLEAERKRRREQGRPWMLDLAPERHGADKRTRILALEPLARNGWALFSAELSEAFMAQLLDFPTARHDDGPDAVAAAVTLARGAGKLDLLPTRLPRATGGTARGF